MPEPKVNETDIVFECPHCGKSLAIDERGVGLIVTCPDCGKRVDVPNPDGPVGADTVLAETDPEQTADKQIRKLSESLSASQEKVREMVSEFDEVQTRRTRLENLRVENLKRFERISSELSIIQAAIDRITQMIQDSGPNGSSADDSSPD